MQSFEELISIVKKLRGENGCAWDKVQTFDSLIPCFLEESYEVVDGISKRDYKNIKEELGDVLLHIVFFSELANDENKFNIDEVIKNINEKQTQLGSAYNRLESVIESIGVSIDNLTSTRSTIRDADIAEESSAYIRNQILQQASATLLATANQTPAIALQLL